MITTTKHILILLISVAIVASCDKTKDPYADVKAQGTVDEVETCSIDTTVCLTDNVPVRKNILIEDFTGHKCGNCPGAAVIADQLHNTYGDQIAVASVHAGFFSTTNSSGKYTTDFTTDASVAYNDLFGNDAAGNPNGFVNRSKIINNKIIIQPTNWESAVKQLKDNDPDVIMGSEAYYCEEGNYITANIHSTFLNSLSGSYKMTLYLTEDSIVDWQKDYNSNPQDIENYVHRHVLRDNLNGTWGEDITSENMTVGNCYKRVFNYSIPDSTWVVNHLSVIAYIYDASTNEILQVTEAHVKNF